MDEAPGEDEMERTRDLLNRAAEGAIEAHDLRVRLAGHGVCDRVEAALTAETPGLVVTIHVEPEGQAKHSGVLVS